ncbi:MAG: DUF4347 domain-containing protein, partial [Calothrix sp. MO_167.B12]|nr:DUF4347 domain-containing protein [Calothrix sp. MO_167.B12]
MTKIALNNQIKTISTQRVNLAIFDPRVDDLSVLLGGLQPGVCAHVLDSELDGVEQISEILRQQPTASLTLVAHGFPGGLQLGAGTLELDNLHRYASQLRSWFERGDASSLTLLACNVATGDAGAEFVTQVASLTGVTVSAASTPVGNGQWPLVAANTFTSTVFEAYVATLGVSFNQVFKDETDGVDGLDGAYSVTVSPDGKQVFVASSTDDALTVFDRDASGNLTFKTVFKNGTDGVDGLDSARAVTVSPDGKQVFVTGSNDDALAVFDRDDSGNLTFKTV